MTQPSKKAGACAAVLGASMAGLLAARALADHFDDVVLLERDELSEGPSLRKGTPQAFQPHGILARGRAVIEELFPGITTSLADRGAMIGDLHNDVPFEAGQRRLARFADGRACGYNGMSVSRSMLEAEIRRHVLALTNVRAITGVSVIAPVFDPARKTVTGVRYASREGGGDEQTLSADMVVDCTGRGSRTPVWLREWGYDPPEEERLNVGICYVSAYFKRQPDEGSGLAALIRSATPDLPRPAVLLAQEPDADGVHRWVVGLGGYAGDHVEISLESMRKRAVEIGSKEMIRITHEAELVSPVQRHQFPHSQRRRYERLARFPEGFLVFGDALSSFNPIYGQGMTVAACEALELREALGAGLNGLCKRFFRKAAKIVDIPWQLAVGSDLALPSVPGPRPLQVRLVNAYIAKIYEAAERDPVVALAFLKVVHLIERPESLFAPAVLARVLFRAPRETPAREAPVPA